MKKPMIQKIRQKNEPIYLVFTRIANGPYSRLLAACKRDKLFSSKVNLGREIWRLADGESIMRAKAAANGDQESCKMSITITPEIQKDGGWYLAFCPEVPEANG
jgi:hypothetical protein